MIPENDFIEMIKSLLKANRFDLTNEKTLQADLARVFSKEKIPFKREHWITKTDCIDFYFEDDAFGLEVKVKGSALSISRQLDRYCKSWEVSHIILVSTRPYPQIPDELHDTKIVKIIIRQL